MKIINLPSEYEDIFRILGNRLGVDSIDVTVEYHPSEELSIAYSGEIGRIKCSKKHLIKLKIKD